MLNANDLLLNLLSRTYYMLIKLYTVDSIRFEKEVAAEALRINENDIHKSLDDLTNPQTTSALLVITYFCMSHWN